MNKSTHSFAASMTTQTLHPWRCIAIVERFLDEQRAQGPGARAAVDSCVLPIEDRMP